MLGLSRLLSRPGSRQIRARSRGSRRGHLNRTTEHLGSGYPASVPRDPEAEFRRVHEKYASARLWDVLVVVSIAVAIFIAHFFWNVNWWIFAGTVRGIRWMGSDQVSSSSQRPRLRQARAVAGPQDRRATPQIRADPHWTSCGTEP